VEIPQVPKEQKVVQADETSAKEEGKQVVC